ncbi:hypothetical protein [Chryseobacterium sp. JK1]|uniref:hypothetical protein n=1 Tax=Chryseobacterium sp. JK1 TaxID=874294 RepID=UPI003D681865
MCNCSKPVTITECERLKKYARDPEGRFFIYHIFDGRGLEIAYVENDNNPNRVAIERGFINSEGLPEWFNVKEHPCIYEEEKKQN